MAIAHELDINARTLQRRLAQDGISFRQLLDECSRQQAETYLREHQLPVAEVSRRLGYSDSAHFVRAFRRWTGVSPGHFSRQSSKR